MSYMQFSHLIFHEVAKSHMLEKRKELQQMVLGKLGIHMWKNENRPLATLLCTKLATNGSKT